MNPTVNLSFAFWSSSRFISPLWWPLYETRVEETLQRSKKLEEDMGEDDEEGERDEEEEEEEVAQASA